MSETRTRSCWSLLDVYKRQMLERPEEIIGGATYLAKMFGVDKVIIGVEDNKQNGIDAMNKVIAEKKAPVVVEPLRCRYPQGGEKQLIQAITGRQVPPGGLPADVGCAVFNINTTICIFKAITTGMPVVNKVVTVSGSGIVDPKNIECPIGTPVSLLLDACGGVKDGTYKPVSYTHLHCGAHPCGYLQRLRQADAGSLDRRDHFCPGRCFSGRQDPVRPLHSVHRPLRKRWQQAYGGGEGGGPA